MEKQPVVITRSQLGQWGSFIGATALLFGALGLIWQGGLTIYIGILLIVGILGIALWVIMSPQEFTAFITGRQARYGTTAFFSTLLIIGIVGLTYIIIQRSVITLDMTQDRRFSLSPESREVLVRLTQPMRITGFYTSNSLALRETDDQFFRLYEIETEGLITRQYINPEEQPAVAEAFGAVEDGSVFLSLLNPDGTINYTLTTRVPRTGRQERDVTGSVARLLISGVYKVYFETGHGGLDPISATQESISQLNNTIRENGLITAPFDLAQIARDGGAIPGDAAALILARPTIDLTQQEVDLINAYLQQGGGMLILTDMLFTETPFMGATSPFNQYMWNTYGIGASNLVIVDQEASIGTALDLIGGAVYTNSPVGSRLDPAVNPTLFRIVRAIDVNDTPPLNISNGRIMTSSAISYGETDLQALAQTNTYAYDQTLDVVGPLTIAAWAYNETNDARIVLIGDSDFATNGFLSRGLGNSILLMDSISWITGYNEQIIFQPESSLTSPLLISQPTVDAITFFTSIIMPGLVLMTGLYIWRKRQAGR